MKHLFALVVMMLSAFSTASAEGKVFVTDSVHITGYALGAYKSDRDLKEFDLRDRTDKYVAIGFADGTPFKRCGSDAFCSKEKNQALALLRASEAAEALVRRGVHPSRIFTRGLVVDRRSALFRGVSVYVLHEDVAVSVPPTVSVPAKAPVVAQVAPETPSKQAVQPASESEEKVVHHEVTSPVSHQSFANVDVGLGVAGTNMKHGVDSFTPTLSLFIKPRTLPFELVLEGGYRPQRSSDVCNRADVSGALGVHIPIREPIGITSGIFTDREMCRDGGHKLTERWIERTNGVYLGLTSGIDVGKGLVLDFSPGLVWGKTSHAQDDKHSSSGFGVRVGIDVRSNGNKH